jgi:hypothetical protein
VKLCVNLQKSSSGALEILKTVYDECTMSKSNISILHKIFREGREDVNGDERQGATVTKRTDDSVQKIKEPVRSDLRLTCRMEVDEVHTCKEIVREILV